MGERLPFWIAQVCGNGHVISPQIDNYPGASEKYCSTCGTETISACQSCKAPLRGRSRYHNMGDLWTRPTFCVECGVAFPWTTNAISAARELAVAENVAEMDRTVLPEIIENLLRDTAQTPVAATRLKNLLAKVSPVAGEGFKQILISVVTESAKRLIWP